MTDRDTHHAMLGVETDEIPTFYGPSFPGPSVDKNGHISVTLDFIPVTERLPENPREVFAFVDGSLRRCHYLESGRGMEWKICGKATYFSKGLVTHWAEIPAIKEVKP